MTGQAALIALVVTVLVVAAVFAILHERKRRQALRDQARQLGLRLSEGRDRALSQRYEFLKGLRSGSNRYAQYVFSGRYRDEQVTIFEHHHETRSGGKHPQTHHHWQTVTVLDMPWRCPELTIAREGFLSKIAQAVGYEDIDFESHEFSRRFVVRSADRRFAYAFIHPRVMELLLARIQLLGHIELEHRTLALIRQGRLNPNGIADDLGFLVDLRGLVPDHLLSESGHA